MAAAAEVTDLTVAEIARAARKVLGPGASIDAHSDIVRDLHIDSLALMNIVMELEDTFDVSIPLDRLGAVRTVGDLAALIRQLKAQG